MKHTIMGFLAGCLVAILVWLIESTTDKIVWGLILSFPISWGIAGYLFSRWDKQTRELAHSGKNKKAGKHGHL